MQLFIDNIEKELFNLNNIRKTRNNLQKEETLALSEIKSCEDEVVRVQDEVSRFAVLNTNSYVEKVEQQINRSCLDTGNSDSSSEFKVLR